MKETKIINVNDTNEYDIYIGRGTIWGNPYRIGKDGNREEVIKKHKEYLLKNKYLLSKIEDLRGKMLGCHCKPKKCHGDNYIEVLHKQIF